MRPATNAYGMAAQRASGAPPVVSPAAALSLVLFVEPSLEWREVVEDRRRVHLLLPGDRLQRLGPRAALPHLQHLVQLRARLLAVVDRAAVERTLKLDGLAERSVELELEDAGQEVARVWHVRRD